MQTLRMDTSLLGSFLAALKAFGTLIAPVERSPGVFTLEPIDDVSKARPDALRTVLPFKKLLLKPQFTMLERRPGSESIDSTDNDWPPMVYFGAHACDIHALKILDLLYLNDFVDPYYKRNRDRLTVMAYGCMPDEKCFCSSQGTANVDDGFDLALTPLEGRYVVTVASARGDAVRANPHLFGLDKRIFLSMAKVLGLDEKDSHLEELYIYVEKLFPNFKVAEGMDLTDIEPMSTSVLPKE